MRLSGVQLAVVCALVSSGAVVGCGDGATAGGGSDLAAMVPPDVPLYAEAVLQPDDDQRAAIESLTSEVAGLDDPGAELISLLDQSLADQPGDFTYADDIEPWLGDRGAFFVRSFESDGMDPDGAVLVEVSDAGAAQDFIDGAAEADPDFPGKPRTYDDFDYRVDKDANAVGVVDDAVVFGTEEAFKVVVDASGGESLAASDEYQARTDPLDGDQLGLLYLEPSAAIQAAVAAGDLDPSGARLARGLLAGPLSDPVTLGLSATERAATIDVVASVDGAAPASPADTLSDLPADPWVAAEVPDAGPLLERWLDALAHSGVPRAASIEQAIAEQTGLDLRRDVTGWLGDTSLFYRGSDASDLAVGLIAETADPEGPRALVDRLAELAQTQSPLPLGGPPEGADYGFTVGLPVVGPRAEVGVIGNRFVATFGSTADQLINPGETLGSAEAFQAGADELGADFPPVLYVDVPRAFELAVLGADSPAESASYEARRPYVEKLGSFVAGARVDGDLILSRLILTLAAQ